MQARTMRTSPMNLFQGFGEAGVIRARFVSAMPKALEEEDYAIFPVVSSSFR